MKVPVKPIYNSGNALHIRLEDGKERVILLPDSGASMVAWLVAYHAV